MNENMLGRAARLRKICSHPALGEKLGDYVLDILEDSVAEEVEDHLLDCRHCRERYLKALEILGTTQGGRAAPDKADIDALSGARVLRMADFKDRRG